MQKVRRKHRYRIRLFGPLWWVTRIGGAIVALVGTYACVCAMAAMTLI